MSDQLPDFNQIGPYLKRLEIIRQTAQQLQKDFALFDYELRFSGNAETAYEELFQQIEPYVSDSLERQAESFFSLLYAVDIDEGQLRQILMGDTTEKPAASLTAMIIERELKKVLIRRYFSSGNMD